VSSQRQTLRGRRSNRSVLAVCICFVALTNVQCGTDVGGNETEAEEASGTTFTVLYDADERIFGPYWSVDAWFLMFLPLATWDESGEAIGRLVRSWEHSRDYRTWIFHLRPDVRWHDGVPVTAHDVKWSIELAGNPDVLYDDPWHDVDSIRVRNDTTLTIFYGRPKDARNTWMVYWPRHLLEGLDPAQFYQWKFWIQPVGDGPYRYVRHVPKTMVELEANAEFYAGKPAIDRVVIKFGGDNGITELLSGNVDAIAWANPADVPKLAADPRFRVYHQIGPGIPWLQALFWNVRSPLFGDRRVRRALTHAIDRRELLGVLNLPEDLRLTDVLFTGRQYHRGELPPPLGYDPEKARAMLREAGWLDGDGDGVLERAGESLRFTALAPQGAAGHAAIYVQAALRKVGVHMEIQTLDMNVLRGRVQGGEFEAVFFPYWNSVDGQIRWLAPGLDSGDGTQQERRSAGIGYDNPEVARLLASVRETADPDQVDSIYRDLAPLIRRDLPITFLYPEVTTYVVHRRVRGLESPFHADPIQFMEQLWIEDEP